MAYKQQKTRKVLFLLALLPLVALAGESLAEVLCPQKKIETVRLPDLNIARNSHNTLIVGGLPMVFGGHTDGFKPTATAEYFQDGQWHLCNMVYTHDGGMAVPLTTGQVFLAGGHKDDLGIGQIYSVEKCYSVAHTQSEKTGILSEAQDGLTFEGFGCLDTKRTFCNGIELDSGRVVISGNWYHNDGIELFDGRKDFVRVKDVVQPRSFPYIFRTSRDNAIIFSNRSTKLNEMYDTIIVDRLHGDPFTPSLFQKWKPLEMCWNFYCNESCIGEEGKEDYSYLFPVADSTNQVAIALLRDEDFSLLPTDNPVPMKGLIWLSPVVADRHARRAYLVGTDWTEDDKPHVFYVLTIDYARSPAALTLCHTDSITDVGYSTPVLTPNGNLLIAGGMHNSNFSPFASAIVLCVGNHHEVEALATASAWWPSVLLMLVLVGIALYLLYRYLRKPAVVDKQEQARMPAENSISLPQGDVSSEPLLLQRISQLMEQQQVFLNSELKIQDVADALGTNRTYISNSIKDAHGCSFTQYVNTYRVDYAQKMLRQHPDTKMSEVWTTSGFSTEVSFFRTFKTIVGMTPKEWMEKKD